MGEYDLDFLRKISNPALKRASFVAFLSEEIYRLTNQYPIVVGGEAVELYTQGGYSTGDIDIKAPRDAFSSVLKKMGFSNVGRTWGNADLDIYIECLGSNLEEGEEAEQRTVFVEIDNRKIRVISFEDLIIDRLNASKWWNDADSQIWAENLYRIGKSVNNIDEAYLQKMAVKNEVVDKLDAILQRCNADMKDNR